MTKRAHTADLTQLASGIAVPLKRGLRLRLVTEQELSDSADSFALEAAELRDRHLLVAGSDVASAIQVDREHLRLDCERRLRGLTRQLRNRALQGLSRHEGEEVLRVVRDTVHALVIVAHHALGLQAPKESLPADRLSLLRALCDAADVPAAALVDWVSQLDAGRATDPLAGLDVLLPVLESTSHWVDGLGT